jgi:hypothetical protein
MYALQARSHRAYMLLDAYGRELIMEGLRPKQRDARLESLLERFLQTAAELARLLEMVNQERTLDRHRPALEAAVAEYADCESQFTELASVLSTFELGWAQQRRMQSDALKSLRQQWNEFRTHRRKLYKDNRHLFEPLGEWF